MRSAIYATRRSWAYATCVFSFDCGMVAMGADCFLFFYVYVQKCLDCPDFDTCASCFRIMTEQHPGHGFVRVADPADLIRPRMTDITGHAMVDRHPARCNQCDKVIYGIRYKGSI